MKNGEWKRHMSKVPDYKILMHAATMENVAEYLQDLQSGAAQCGAYLKRAHGPKMPDNSDDLINALLSTKLPRIFAESEIRGDGSDWTMRELSILGDINVAVKAQLFDNGTWSPSDVNFKIHHPPLEGHLLFTPGALLQSNSPDLAEICDATGKIDDAKYNALVERRLWPLLAYANDTAAIEGVPALVALPGIGCGAFAGVFRGMMGEKLNGALKAMLEKHADNLPNIAAVYFDPFGECKGEDAQFGVVKYRVRPSSLYPGRPQLSDPAVLGDGADDFSGCRLYKIVAWDHASLPGNDYYAMQRFTDDGVSAAASDVIGTLTGVAGRYEGSGYMPPDGFDTWEDVAFAKGTALQLAGNFFMPLPSGKDNFNKSPRSKGPAA